MIRASRLASLFVGMLCVACGARAQTTPSLLEWGLAQDASGGTPVVEKVPNSKLEGLSVYWDNDGGILKMYDQNDRHYTNGLGVEIAEVNRLHTEWERTGIHPEARDDA